MERGREKREDANGGGREQWSEGGEQWRERGRDGGKAQGREGNFKEGTLTSIQHTAHKTTHNAALALETLVLQIQMLNGYRYTIL